ncbi:hypothetical protein ASPCADRAFT_127280 [Aspergillus carbonarius ITEM 5010]|uniref:Uncharacterized protein n=1 Tax=Aspergillus carbonarius (strain ITEM 5010) TaxID=602072 RepID=A0A1R3RVY8_ASPC5|nr:hypothetical protein ASPCADRAFT_127280 [Aspergillus carbonarius ITEM 5010]
MVRSRCRSSRLIGRRGGILDLASTRMKKKKKKCPTVSVAPPTSTSSSHLLGLTSASGRKTWSKRTLEVWIRRTLREPIIGEERNNPTASALQGYVVTGSVLHLRCQH